MTLVSAEESWKNENIVKTPQKWFEFWVFILLFNKIISFCNAVWTTRIAMFFYIKKPWPPCWSMFSSHSSTALLIIIFYLLLKLNCYIWNVFLFHLFNCFIVFCSLFDNNKFVWSWSYMHLSNFEQIQRIYFCLQIK